MAYSGGYGSAIEEARACPPFAARATLRWVPASYASSSTIRLTGPAVAWTSTRTRSAVTAGKESLRQTLLFPVTEPLDTVTQAVPLQYWTSKAVMPYLAKVSVAV